MSSKFGLFFLTCLLLATGRPSGRSWAERADGQAPALADLARQAIGAFDGPQRADLERVRSDGPDVPAPWGIVDELQYAGRLDVADWWVQRVGHSTTRRSLEEYLARHRTRLDAPGMREAFERATGPNVSPREARAALLPHLAQAALPAAEVRVLAVRSAWHLAWACGALEDGDGQKAALEACATAAARLGGWAQAEMAAALGLGVWHVARGDSLAALKALEHVLPLVPDHADYEQALRVLLDLGALHLELGNVDEFERVTASVGTRPVPRAFAADAALARSNLGLLAMRRGRLAEALAYHRQAQALLSDVEAPAHALEVRLRIAGVQEMTGLLDEASAELSAVRTGFQSLPEPDVQGEAITLGNLGRALALSRRFPEARAALDAAESLFRGLEEVPSLWRIAIVRAWIGSLTEPRDEELAAVRALLALDDPRLTVSLRVQALEALARCHLRRSQADLAVDLLARAVSLLPDVPEGETLRIDLPGAFGVALAHAGRKAEALEQFDRYVVGAAGSIDGLDWGSRATFRGLCAREILEAAVAGALATRDFPRLWRYLEAGRGLKLLASLGGRSALGEALLPADLHQRLLAVQERELAARRELALAKDRLPILDPAWAGLRQNHDGAVQRRLEVAAEVDAARRFAGRDDLGSSAELKSVQSLRQRLDPGQLVVSLTFSADPPGVLAFAVSPAGLDVRVVPLEDALVRRAGELRELASRAANSDRPVAELAALRQDVSKALEEIRSAVVEHLRIPAGTKRVVFVPEGALCYVPYAALFPQVEVAVATSGTLHLRLLSEARRSGTRSLALGNPDYTGRTLTGDMSLLAQFTPDASRAGRLRLLPLPHTGPEAQAVAGTRGVALLGNRATAAALLEALREHAQERWRSIHFACHGLIHGEQPTLSGLALTDGLLTPLEILPLRLNTDLVVLSACESATDVFVQGEGISGLVRAFLHAGAPRVLASLWQVPDAPTRALMERLHERLADPAVSVAQALLDAQAHVRAIDGGKWSSPENWAAWILWGVP